MSASAGSNPVSQFCQYLSTQLSNLDKKDRFEAIRKIEDVMGRKEGQEIYM